MINIDTISKRKNFIVNICFSLISSAVPILILQCVCYPYIANKIGVEGYGLMLTIYSVVTLFSSTLSGAISSVRILNVNNEKRDGTGDFLIIINKYLLFISISIILILFLFFNIRDIKHVFLCLVMTIIIFVETYIESDFRIILNYKKILICKILLTTGYLFGMFIFKTYWEAVFIIGYLLSLCYCIYNSFSLKDKLNKSINYNDKFKDTIKLSLSSFINNFSNYFDRLLLYPLMDGTSVSIYYVSTIFGKVISLVLTSLVDVVLSFISSWPQSKKNIMTKVLLILMPLFVISYFIINAIGKYLINYLYPQIANLSIVFLPYTTIAILINSLSTVIYPFTLKYCSKEWQIIINILFLSSNLFFVYLLWTKYQLLGFCYGTIISALIKLITMIIVYYKNTEEKMP